MVVAHFAGGALVLVASHLGVQVAFLGAAHFQAVVSQHEQGEEEGQVLGVDPGVGLGLVAAAAAAAE